MPDFLPTPALDELDSRYPGAWPSMAEARRQARLYFANLTESVQKELDIPADCSLVIFGSLARGEWTDGSDLDWALLVDGQVSAAHYEAMLAARVVFEARNPGSTGTFGGLAFSHDLVHVIGGQDDSNRNLTLRMLLLLESIPVGDAAAYERVVTGVLERFLVQPSSFASALTPRFLLNDLVRFWRTMGVDFADKFHDQAGKKAVLRNVKLRFSRKLLYAAGLYACLSWYLNEKQDARTTIAHFRKLVETSPLEMLADACIQFNLGKEVVSNIFDSYEIFLVALCDQDQRANLERMRAPDAAENPLFQTLRDKSHYFQEGLLGLLSAGGLRELLLKYAIF